MDVRVPATQQFLQLPPITAGHRFLKYRVKDAFTVKRYSSAKVVARGGTTQKQIVLSPLNPDFEPIVITAADEESVQVIAELVRVL